jgi:hypothetical protein
MSRFGFLESMIRPLSNSSMTQYSSFGANEDFLSAFGPGSAYRANKLMFGKMNHRFGDHDSDHDSDSEDEDLDFGKSRKRKTTNKKVKTVKTVKKTSKRGKSAAQRKNQSNAAKAMRMAAAKGISLKAAWKKVKKE